MYAVLQGEEIPDRKAPEIPGISSENKKKKRKKQKGGREGKEEGGEKVGAEEKVPDALEKVMKEFYQGDQEAVTITKVKTKKNKHVIGKDSLELKHEYDLAKDASPGKVIKDKKKKKKQSDRSQFEELSKEFISITGDRVEGMNINPTPMKLKKKSKDSEVELPTKRNVAFNLKLNTTQVFDKKHIINTSISPRSSEPPRGILKVKHPKSNPQNPKKKAKLSNN